MQQWHALSKIKYLQIFVFLIFQIKIHTQISLKNNWMTLICVLSDFRETVEELSSETERLKRSLTAKDEVERTQIEAIHQLTAKNKKMENEVNQLQGQLDDLTQKYDTLKKSHDAAKKELIDKNKASSELLAREQLLETLENEKNLVESQKEQVRFLATYSYLLINIFVLIADNESIG